MKIKGFDSNLLQRARAYGPTEFIDFIENGGEIGLEERECIVRLLREMPSKSHDSPSKSTAPRRKPEREMLEARIVIEITRIMFLWNVNASKAQVMLLNEYRVLNDNTVKSYWRKHRVSTKITKTTSLDGVTDITRPKLKFLPLEPIYRARVELALIVGIPSLKGQLANLKYPEGYESIGQWPMQIK